MKTEFCVSKACSFACLTATLLATSGASAQLSPSGALEFTGHIDTGRQLIDFPQVRSDCFSSPKQSFTGAPLALPDTLTSPLPQFKPDTSPLPDRPGTVTVELTDDATPEHHARAQQISNAWAHGAYDTARTLLDSLSADGVLIGAGFSWEETGHLENGFNPDRRVGGTRTGPRKFAIDYNPANNNIFVAILWNDIWTLNRSIDNGFTWNETFVWFSGGSQIADIDMVVAGNFVYTAYIPGDGNSVRMRRNTLPAGTEDGVYFFETVFTGTGAQLPFREVAIESNIDNFNNRLYAAALQNNGALRWMYTDPTNAVNYTEEPPLVPGCVGDIADDFGFTAAQGGGPDGVVDFGDFVALLGLVGPCPGGTPGCLGDIADDFGFTAAQGGGPDGVVDFGDFVALLGLIGPCTNFGVAGSIDMHWNRDFSDYFLYLSYRTTQNQVQVQRAEAGVFTNIWDGPRTIDTTSSAFVSNPEVRISAHNDTVIVAFQRALDIRYQISYNGGNSYNFGFGNTTPPDKFNVDVTARRGYGTAVVTTGEVGEPDDVYINRRAGYAPGGWAGFLKFNSVDVHTGATPLAIQALPTAGAYSYGMMYRGSDGAAYFDRISN